MKKLNFLITGILFAITSCGDAGVGFDVTADFPVTGPVNFVIPASPFTDQNVNPDVTEINYSLNEVDAFSDALNDLESQGGISPDDIEIIELSYEINGISSDEQLPIEENSLDVNTASGTVNIPIISGGGLTDVSKTVIPLSTTDKSAIINELQRASNIDTDIIVDIGTIPTSSVEQPIVFDFKLYFNVLLKVRDLN